MKRLLTLAAVLFALVVFKVYPLRAADTRPIPAPLRRRYARQLALPVENDMERMADYQFIQPLGEGSSGKYFLTISAIASPLDATVKPFHFSPTWAQADFLSAIVAP